MCVPLTKCDKWNVKIQKKKIVENNYFSIYENLKWRMRFPIKQPTRCVNIQHLFCHKTLHVSGIFCAHHQEFLLYARQLVRFMQAM